MENEEVLENEEQTYTVVKCREFGKKLDMYRVTGTLKQLIEYFQPELTSSRMKRPIEDIWDFVQRVNKALLRKNLRSGKREWIYEKGLMEVKNAKMPKQVRHIKDMYDHYKY